MRNKYAFSLIAILGALTSQLSATGSGDDRINISHRHRSDRSECTRCRGLDIRQGPGFRNFNEQNPFVEEIFDDDPMDFTPDFF